MAIDPQAQTVLDLVTRAGRPPYFTLSPGEARQLFRETRQALVPPPPEMVLVKDLMAEGPASPIPLRLFRPPGAPARAPALVYFHGGGWVIGDLDTHDVLCRQLAASSDSVVVSVDYRLAPEQKFPAAVEDSWAATRWVAAHAGALDVDGQRLAVGGDSAGGNLAAVVSIMARDAGGPDVRFQLLIYPATDMAADAPSQAAFADGYLLTRDSVRWFIGHYLRGDGDVADWRASPLRASSLAGLPPALVVTAGFDPLRDEGQAYATRLAEAGVRVDHVCYGGMLHGFFGMGGVIDTANRAIAHAGASIRQALAA